MLALHHHPERLRKADNLVPTHDGGMASRPAAKQIVSGRVLDGKPWGNRLLMDKAGRLVLWDGEETDLGQAGSILQATAYQALTANAQREDRLYVADGTNPLFYIVRRNTAYVRATVTNEVTDANGAPYDIPVPRAIANWRDRLWITGGDNRLQHCQNENPHYWDPLWTVELQGDEPDSINAIQPHGDVLAAGLKSSLWLVSGDSQYNWQRTPVKESKGSSGPDCMASDGESLLYWVSSKGLHQMGRPESLSEDLRELFMAPLYGGHAVIDSRRQLLLCLIRGRLFTMHLARPGLFGEIAGVKASGLFEMRDYVGWYGEDGAWVLLGEDMPDARADGTQSDVSSVYETWEVMPNLGGDGRDALERTILQVRGSARGNMTYEVEVDGAAVYSNTATLTDESVDVWSASVTEGAGQPRPVRPVRREFAPHVAGQAFLHRISATCHMEVRRFEPRYRSALRGDK